MSFYLTSVWLSTKNLSTKTVWDEKNLFRNLQLNLLLLIWHIPHYDTHPYSLKVFHYDTQLPVSYFKIPVCPLTPSELYILDASGVKQAPMGIPTHSSYPTIHTYISKFKIQRRVQTNSGKLRKHLAYAALFKLLQTLPTSQTNPTNVLLIWWMPQELC